LLPSVIDELTLQHSLALVVWTATTAATSRIVCPRRPFNGQFNPARQTQISNCWS